MDRRPTALVLLLLFALCTGVAILISGSRPGLEQGLAPALVQFAGYASALLAGVLLLASSDGGADDGPAGGPRRIGAVVLVTLVALVLLELIAAGGPNIGAGAVQLLGIVVIMAATIRLALGVVAERMR